MAVSDPQRKLLMAMQEGLPIMSRPYREIGDRIGMSEDETIRHLGEYLRRGLIKRLGVVVRHHELGFCNNAMVVWDVPDERVDNVGEWLGRQQGVNLVYRRPRRPPQWPYNLFCMIHGRSRGAVRNRIAALALTPALTHIPHEVLFSKRRFKQRGARYIFEDGKEGSADA